MSEAADGGYAELVAAPDSESEAVANELRLVRAKNAVGGRIIRIGVHRVRPDVLSRGGEADVDRLDLSNLYRHEVILYFTLPIRELSREWPAGVPARASIRDMVPSLELGTTPARTGVLIDNATVTFSSVSDPPEEST